MQTNLYLLLPVHLFNFKLPVQLVDLIIIWKALIVINNSVIKDIVQRCNVVQMNKLKGCEKRKMGPSKSTYTSAAEKTRFNGFLMILV